jgi:hypothetical protein
VSRRAAARWLAALTLLAFRPEVAPADDDDQALQVTVFGIVATPGESKTDPKLATIAAQLRKLKPDHGFQLRGHKSEQLVPGETVRCELGDDLTAEAKLLEGVQASGKLRIEFALKRAGKTEFTTTVTTPANQLFFCDKPLPGDDRLLIGVGAR